MKEKRKRGKERRGGRGKEGRERVIRGKTKVRTGRRRRRRRRW